MLPNILNPSVIGKARPIQIFSPGYLHDTSKFYELHLEEGDLEYLTLSAEIFRGKVAGIHNPKSVSFNGANEPFNLANEGEYGDYCEQMLAEIIILVSRLGGRYVTTHAGYFQPKKIAGIHHFRKHGAIVRAIFDDQERLL